jgi:hypothetical protein
MLSDVITPWKGVVNTCLMCLEGAFITLIHNAPLGQLLFFPRPESGERGGLFINKLHFGAARALTGFGAQHGK